MKYFFDTEFIEDGKTIDLISIGIVCEDGRELYCVNQEANLCLASPWVRQNVLPHLPKYGDPAWMSHDSIKSEVLRFVYGSGYIRTFDDSLLNVTDTKPEFWAYYADYDWVAFCQLFGTMMDLPQHFPKFCMDLKQLLTALYFTGKHDQISKSGKLKNRIWHFQCECGAECEYPIRSVVVGDIVSCGCFNRPRKHKDWTGQKFGLLTAIKDTGKSTTGKYKHVIWLFKCDCGNEIEFPATRVVNNNTTSCGCLRAKEFEGEKQLAYQLYLNYENNEQKKFKIPFPISFDKFCKLIKQSCFYCGKPPHRTLKARGTELTYNGIDAIDCKKPHIESNYVVACLDL